MVYTLKKTSESEGEVFDQSEHVQGPIYIIKYTHITPTT